MCLGYLTLDNSILLDKLNCHGSRSVANKLFQSYLSNRYQNKTIEICMGENYNTQKITKIWTVKIERYKMFTSGRTAHS